MNWIDFPPLAEFVDRSGITRSIHGCSLMGRFEFADRLRQLKSILTDADADCNWEDLLYVNHEFRFVVDRCLQLNHIDPDWVTGAMVEQLLIGRREGDEWLPGWLVELNSTSHPKSRQDVGSQGEGCEPNLAEVLAALSTHCQGLTEAIELSQNVPARVLTAVLEAKAESLKSPEQKQEEVKKTRLEQLRGMYVKYVGANRTEV